MSAPCNATHQHNGGVQCELDEGHAGLHVHGQDRGEVVFWGGARDLSTRAELLAELARLTDGSAMAAFDGSVSDDAMWTVAVPIRNGMRARTRAILATLYGAGSGAEAGDPSPEADSLAVADAVAPLTDEDREAVRTIAEGLRNDPRLPY